MFWGFMGVNDVGTLTSLMLPIGCTSKKEFNTSTAPRIDLRALNPLIMGKRKLSPDPSAKSICRDSSKGSEAMALITLGCEKASGVMVMFSSVTVFWKSCAALISISGVRFRIDERKNVR